MDQMRKLRAFCKHAALVITLSFTCVSCGPVLYMSTVTRGASSAVEAAKSARADKYAPYYYTLAVEYLSQARREAARSDFQAANHFGKKSKEAADKARTKALAKAREGGVSPSAAAAELMPSPSATAPAVEKSNSSTKKGEVE